MTLPRNVRRFAWLWWGAIVIELVGLPQAWVRSWTIHAAIAQLVVVIVALAIFLTLFYPLFWLAVWRRKNWARWVLLLAFIVGEGLGLMDTEGVIFPRWYIGVELLTTAVAALGFYFLFTGDAQPWFQRQNSN